MPTDDNISDLPSREEYELLSHMGFRWKQPVVAQLVIDGMPVAPDGPVAAH